MDTTITGDAVPASSDSQPMGDRSGVSPKSGRTHTTRTANLTPEMALEILEAAVLKCQEAGISIGTSEYYTGGNRAVVIVIDGCIIDDAKHLQLHVTTSGKAAE